MKLVAIILLIFNLTLSARSISQTTISLWGNDLRYERIFAEIKKQTGYLVVGSKGMFKKTDKTSVKADKMELKEFMRMILEGTPYEFEIRSKTIFIKEKTTTHHSSSTNYSHKNSPPVSGIIRGPDGQPLAGVNVMIKGSKKGTVTDNDGRFTIEADQGSVLEISSIGYGKKEINVNGAVELVIELEIASSLLDEVQYIAYGQTTKRLNVGNIGTVKAADIEKQPVQNPLLALQGRVPGLIVTQSTGLPGSGVAVQIQGMQSIAFNVSNDPLYVIDGVPYTSRLMWTLSRVQGSSGENSPSDLSGLISGAGNPLSFINPWDIESIEVLKDADATSIYGSRAANGAILITTKKGKAGQTKITVNYQQGWGKVNRKLDLLNTSQYLEIRNEAFANTNTTPDIFDVDLNGTWDSSRYTDWQETLIGETSNYYDAQASISGGTANIQFFVNGGYHNETTVFPGDLSDKKGSIHFSLNSSTTNRKLKFQLTGSYMVDNNNLIGRDLTEDAIRMAPVAPKLYNDDGSLNWAPDENGSSTWTNPLAYLNNKYTNNTYNLISNSVLSYELFDGFYIKGNIGFTRLTTKEMLTNPHSSLLPELRMFLPRTSSFSQGSISSWIAEPQLSYTKLLGKARIEGLIGLTFQETVNDRHEQAGSGYSNDLLMETIAAAPYIYAYRSNAVYKYNALFGRLNINWLEKYVLNLTVRRDGSSRFGSENQFHDFGSVGIGWIFSEEKFMKNSHSVLSFGKLRGSFGTTGNDQIGDYQFLSLYSNIYSPQPYQNAVGLEPSSLSNPYLQWEETKKLQFGLDLGFFEDRLMFSSTYYYNTTNNQLSYYALPVFTGFERISRNFPAKVANSGWEFSLFGSPVSSNNFTWNVNVNLTIPKNELVDFPGIETSTYSQRLEIGQPVMINKTFDYLGVDPATGIYQFDDGKKGSTSRPDTISDSRTAIVNTAPKFYGGFQNNIRFKGFELDFLFQFVKQVGPNYLFGYRPGEFFGQSNLGNQPTYVLDRWRKPGDITNIQQVDRNSNLVNEFLNATSSDGAYSDASFIRLKNISLGWHFPPSILRKLHMQDARIFVQGQNVLTITDYLGLDPETRSSTTLPPLRVITIGAHLSL